MSFIPEKELYSNKSMSLAPMIDFLFLMLVFFATLAISRITTRDTEIDLVKIRPEEETKYTLSPSNAVEKKIILLAITANNEYKWVTDIRDHKMESAQDIYNELVRQYEKGLLPKDTSNTHILLKIDKNATWEPILSVIFAVRDAGFNIRPVYEPELSTDSFQNVLENQKTDQSGVF